MQPKRHNFPLELPQLRPEARLPPVRFVNPTLMVALGKVEFREPLGAPCLVEQCVNVREGLHEGLGDGVEAPVVVADPPRPVRLTREDS